MVKKIDENVVSSKIKDINGIINVDAQESFLLDVVELVNTESITIDQFKEKYLDLIEKINKEILRNQLLPVKKRKNFPIRNEFNNQLEFELGEDIFKFEIYFDFNKMKLVIVHFDKMIKENQITKGRDIFIPLCMIILIIYFILGKSPNTSQKLSLILLLFVDVGHVVLFGVLRKCKRIIDKNNKVIWTNKSTFDLFRKWFRNRSVPDIYKIYFFLSWLNMWLFSLLILATPNQTDNFYIVEMIVVLVIALSTAILAVSYLLRIFNLNYWSTSLLTLFIVLIGFIGKDYWAFVALIFVIVNQILSKDIIYLTTHLNLSRKKDLQHYLSTFEGSGNEIRLKLKTNVAIVLLYLFLIIFNDSKILKPFILFTSPNFPQNPLTNYLLIGIERIVVLCLLYVLLKNPRFSINRNKERIQILINYIASKLYKNVEELTPSFKDELQLYKNEKIEPSELIDNLSIIPSDAKVYWIREPNWDSNDKEIEVEVGVVYSNRSLYRHKSALFREI